MKEWCQFGKHFVSKWHVVAKIDDETICATCLNSRLKTNFEKKDSPPPIIKVMKARKSYGKRDDVEYTGKAKSVVVVKDGIETEYKSMSQAARALGVTRQTIYAYLKGIANGDRSGLEVRYA